MANGFKINFHELVLSRFSWEFFWYVTFKTGIFGVQWLLGPNKFKLHHNAFQLMDFVLFFMAAWQGVKWSKVKGTVEFQFRISLFLMPCSGSLGSCASACAIARYLYRPVDPAADFLRFVTRKYIQFFRSIHHVLISLHLVTTPWIRWSRTENTTTYNDNFGPVSEVEEHQKGQFPRIYDLYG